MGCSLMVSSFLDETEAYPTSWESGQIICYRRRTFHMLPTASYFFLDVSSIDMIEGVKFG